MEKGSVPLLDVQGLRAVAVLLVILYHAGVARLGGGYVGVDVFFVISGYLIGGQLIREQQRRGSIAFVDFYARRARRLLPAAFAAVAGALVVSAVALSPLEQHDVAASAIAATLYASNVLFAWRSTDYLAGQSAADPLLHTWSLAVEEQLYLVWPALVTLAAVGARRGAPARRIAVTLGVVTAASFALCVWLTRSRQPWAFFAMPARAWEFGLGALTYLLTSARREIGRGVREVCGATGLALIAGAALTLDRQSTFPGAVALVPCAGAAMALAAGRGAGGSLASRVLSVAPMRWLGDISYSLYLWHWPALVASAAFGLGPGGTLAALAAAAVAAWMSYAWLEQPIRRHPWLAARPAASLAGALALSLLVASGAWFVRLAGNVDMTSGNQWAFAEARGDLPVVYAHGCNAELAETRLGACAFAHVSSPREIVLYGDSHAAHWFPALEAVAETFDARLVSLTKSACPSVDVAVYAREHLGRFVECDEWRRNMMARILADRPSLVVIANYAYNTGLDGDGRPVPISGTDWGSGLDVVLARLHTAAIPAVIVQDNPRAASDVPVCLSRASWRGEAGATKCRFDLTSPTARAPAILDEERIAVRQFAGASVLDLTAAICEGDPCAVLDGGMPRYRDRHHLTAMFSRSLAPALAAHIEREARAHPASRLNELVRP